MYQPYELRLTHKSGEEADARNKQTLTQLLERYLWYAAFCPRRSIYAKDNNVPLELHGYTPYRLRNARIRTIYNWWPEQPLQRNLRDNDLEGFERLLPFGVFDVRITALLWHDEGGTAAITGRAVEEHARSVLGECFQDLVAEGGLPWGFTEVLPAGSRNHVLRLIVKGADL